MVSHSAHLENGINECSAQRPESGAPTFPAHFTPSLHGPLQKRHQGQAQSRVLDSQGCGLADAEVTGIRPPILHWPAHLALEAALLLLQ